jgi:hypothetical protein
MTSDSAHANWATAMVDARDNAATLRVKSDLPIIQKINRQTPEVISGQVGQTEIPPVIDAF